MFDKLAQIPIYPETFINEETLKAFQKKYDHHYPCMQFVANTKLLKTYYQVQFGHSFLTSDGVPSRSPFEFV